LPTSLTINGTGFIQGAVLNVGGTGGVYFSTTFVSSTQLTVGGVVVESVGAFPIYVIDPAPAGTSGAFNVTLTQPPPPTITSINPSSAQSGSSPTLTITGTNFEFGATVMLNNTSFPVNVQSTTQLAAFVSLGGVAAGTYPLSVVNPIPAPTASNSVNFTVTPPPDFSITATGTTTQTVNAGQTATFTNAISVTAQNGFSSAVDLSCSLPASATFTTCGVNPSLLPNGSGTATVSVTTTSHGLLPPSLPFRRFYPRPELIVLLLLTLLLAALMLRIARSRRHRLVGALPLAMLVLFILFQAIGCGGGSSTPPPPPPPPMGTPAGTYTITVTGNTGSLMHSTTLTLTVK
ncbi:MAG TPA: IPT/TIG domain-containing protein, partial [Candidatus Acidoferrum sp.]